MNTIPRRNQLDKNHPAERAIFNAMREVELMPADEMLTEAVTLLSRAKDIVGDYVDAQPPKCPECLRACTEDELLVFGGFCEECSRQPIKLTKDE